MFFKNYKYFLAIVEYLNISKASDSLYISQSSLSKYLKRLEDKLGVILFDRETSPMKLTSAGEIYLNYIQLIINKEKSLKLEFDDIKGNVTGKITIGLTPWRSATFLPRILPSFMQKYPHIKIELREGSHKTIYTLMDKNEIDFGIVNLQIDYDRFVFEPIELEYVLLATHVHSPILEKLGIEYNSRRKRLQHIDFRELQNESLIQLKAGQNLHLLVRNFLDRNHYQNKVLLETSNVVTALNLVATGMGITFVPGDILCSGKPHKNLAFFTTGSPPLSWELGIAHRKEIALSPSAKTFIEHVNNVITHNEL